MMIEDTTINTSRIPDTSFTYTPQISRFMQALEYNMKARAGINPAVSSEDIAAQRNLEMEEDVTAATERTLTSIDRSNPETMKNVLDSYRAYGRLSRSNPTTAVIESFTDADTADKLKYDGVFRTNATNTDQDYPVYMTRGAIFESVLIDSLENDNPSLYSYGRRFGAGVGLGIAGNIVKGATGMFIAHGATAAYDVARLGTSIKNVQKKYHEWRNRLFNDETLTYDMFLEESKKLVADLKKEVPEEYRYEVYRALQEGPDPFADLGNSFTGLATDIGLIKPVGGIGKTGFTAAKRAMKGVASAASKSKNVQKLQYNEELAEKIQNFATNKVDEEVVEDVVNTKAAVNIPQEASPELQDTVKGIVKEQESDNNLLQNVNNDSYRYDLTVSQEDIAAHNALTSGENRSQAAEEAFNKRRALRERYERGNQKGEIRLERPEQVTVTRVGKGVNNDPMTWEEVQKWRKAEQGRANPITPWKRTMMGETVEFNPDIEPDYIAIQSASRERWTDDINKPGVWNYGGKRKSGEGKGYRTAEAYLAGGYGSVQDSPEVAAEFSYYVKYQPDTREEAFENLARLSDKQIEESIEILDPDYTIRNEALFNPDLFEGEVLEKRLRRNGEIYYDVYDQLFKNTKDPSVITPLDEMIVAALNDYRVGDLLSYYDVSGSIIRNNVYYNPATSKANISEIKKLMNEIKSNSDKYVDDVYQAYEELSKKAKELFPDLNYMKGSMYVDPKEIEAYKYKVINHFNDSDNVFIGQGTYVQDDGMLNVDGVQIVKNHTEEDKYIDFAKAYNEYLGRIQNLMGNLQSLGRAERTLERIEDPNFTPPSSYLQTLGIRNPMKDPSGFLYLDTNRGLRTFSSLFSTGSNEKNTKLLKEIKKKDQMLIDSIANDIKDGWKKEYEPMIKTSKKLADEEFKEFSDSLPDRMVKGDFEDLLERYVMPYSDIKDMPDFKAWQQKYLKSKGIRANFHNMGRSQSFNVAIQNFEDVTPVTLEETNLGTKWWTQIGYHNAHMIESAGDGVGYYGIIVHAPEGAKPIILKNGKIVDKGDWK